MGMNQEIELAISPAIMAETERVLRDKFGFSEDRLEIVRNAMNAFAIQVTPTKMLDGAVPDDPDDDKIVACAVAAGAQAIITGDKHLLKLGSYEGIAVMTVAEFVRERVRER
jgi:uncharacterized protein